MSQKEFKVYVGNLPYKIESDDLKNYFSDCVEGDGQEVIDCTIISDRETGRSKGFGFVQFSDAESMNKAIAKTEQLDDRDLRISEAKPKESRDDRNRSY